LVIGIQLELRSVRGIQENCLRSRKVSSRLERRIGVWNMTNPMTYRREAVEFDVEYRNYAVSSVGYCSSEHATKYIAILAVFHILLLSYVAYLCYLTIGINDVFSEAKYVRIAIGSSLQVLLFSIPVLMVTSGKTDTNTSVFLKSGIIWLNDFTVLASIFLPKMYMSIYGVSKTGVGAEIVELVSKQASSSHNAMPASVAPTGGSTLNSCGVSTILD